MNETEQVQFLPVEQRYVASCYPLPDRPGIDACLEWRHYFAQAAQQNQARLVMSASQLVEPFPHLARLILTGAFSRMTIQQYFEGLQFPEQASGFSFHNPNLYLFAVRLGRTFKQHSDNSALMSALDHVAGCSVKPARLSNNQIITYQGLEIAPIDTSFLRQDSPQTNFVLVHGFNQQGAHQAIRYITPKEYDAFAVWFTARQQSSQNPFIMHV